MHATFHHRKLRGAGDIRADGRTKPDIFYVIELRWEDSRVHFHIEIRSISKSRKIFARSFSHDICHLWPTVLKELFCL